MYYFDLNGYFKTFGNIAIQVGSDGARHVWYKWAEGPVPEGKSLTQSISLYDCTLVTMTSLVGTPSFNWSEENPNSEDRYCERVGLFCAVDVNPVASVGIARVQKSRESFTSFASHPIIFANIHTENER